MSPAAPTAALVRRRYDRRVWSSRIHDPRTDTTMKGRVKMLTAHVKSPDYAYFRG
ncbi:hypothetical protein BN903_191 [Halorubrum sp. AJ67]|nr:hypothetical protein BN903_191 [Halorubrum sp. AJ67]